MPLYDSLPVEQLADLVDAIRVGGDEPPDPFVWFTLLCDDSVVDAWSSPRCSCCRWSSSQGNEPTSSPRPPSHTARIRTPSDTLQIQPAPIGVDAIYAWQVAGGAGDGVRVADLEGGWRLDHDELVSANIRKLSVFGSSRCRPRHGRGGHRRRR